MKFRLIISLILVCGLTFSGLAQTQSVYKFKTSVDIPINVVTLGAGLTGIIKNKKNQPFTESQIEQLVYHENKLDYSSINRSYSKKIHLASDIGLFTLAASPLILLADKKIRKEAKYVIPMWAEAFTMTMALGGMTKELVRRTRPYVYYDDVPLSEKMKKGARASFFSGHTSVSAMSAFFSAKIYADMNPNSKWKPLVWTTAAILPMGVGALRYAGGKHFWTDILTGYAVGAAVGILVPQLHKNKLKN